MLGGGMRQAGILAAAGIVALSENVTRLAEDHRHARKLAQGIEKIPGLSIDVDRVRTNIVYFSVTDPEGEAQRLTRRLEERGVRVLPTGPRQMRAVTHYHIGEEDIDRALVILSNTMISA